MRGKSPSCCGAPSRRAAALSLPSGTVGSGLILLVIVGAWLVVLVPMVLRSHESTAAQNTVDKFHDAMRVLSRRHPAPDPDGAADREAEDEPAARPATSRRLARPDQQDWAGGGRTPATRPASFRRLPDPEPAAPSSGMSAATRRRVLLALLLAVLLTMVGALMGPVWLWAPQIVVDLLLVAFVVHLRAMTLRIQRERRAARERARAAAMRRAARPQRAAPTAGPAAPVAPPAAPTSGPAAARTPRPATSAGREGRSPEIVVRPARPMRVAGVPDRMPPRWAVLDTPLPGRPVVEEEVGEGRPRGAQGAAWLPVPVPPPIYLSAAPGRPRTSSRPTPERSDGVAAAERSLGIDDQGPELGQILGRRTAVND